VRAKFGSEFIADSRNALLLIAYDKEFRTRYYFPQKDVKTEYFEESDYTGKDGNYKYWHIRIGDRFEKNAAYMIVNPPDDVVDVKGYISFKWNAIDHWYEEEEEIFIHPRDPYKRIDIVDSSRHIQVVIDSEIVADTKNPRLLFETGLPVRYYIPAEEVKKEFLIDSDLNTGCPYKGTASYYSVKTGENIHNNVVWYYSDPIDESARIKNYICFYNEKIDIIENGKLLPHPVTPFS
jgi:uncharacterized protein (DUF427 family)